MNKRFGTLVLLGLAMTVAGCGKKPTATVEISHVLQPKQPLSAEHMSIAVFDTRMEGDKGEFDEKKWSEMTANLISYHLERAAERQNIPLKLVDREHMKVALAGKDLAAAGVTEGGDEMVDAKIEGANANLTSKVTIKIDKHAGSGRTVSGLGAFAGRWGGGGNVETEEVAKESRNITVTCQFQLKDAGTNAIVASYNGPPTQHYERGKPSPFFGGAKTEADMTPRDRIIGEVIESQLMNFLVKFVPTEISAVCKVEPSGHEKCAEAVRHLVADDYEAALMAFKQVIAEKQDDDKALFGAGVAAEKLGRFDEALKHYKLAQSFKTKDAQYNAAVERMSAVKGL